MCGCFPRPCPFCHVSTANGFRIVHEDEQFIAFHDRSPGGKLHLLIIPREHIPTVKSLTQEDAPLLESMIKLGHELLRNHGFDPNDAAQTRLGFHVPPFNSVNHLHLHVLGLPLKNKFREWKYKPGYPWFANACDVLARLKNDMSPV